MILLRRIVLYSFIAIYLIFCPMTIFYALGFVYKPGSERGIIKTGLVYVSTVPPGADVYVNGALYEGVTPSVIRNLDPGYYQIRVELKDRQSWSQEVPVEAERASVLEKLLLLPKQFSGTPVSDMAYEYLQAIPKTPFFILARGHQLGDYFIYDFKKKLEYPLVPVSFGWSSVKVARIFSVPQGRKVIVQLEREKTNHFYQIDLTHDDLPKDLTSIFTEEPQKIIWDPSYESHLIAMRDQTLQYLRADKKLIYPKVASHVRGFGVENKSLYVLQKDRTLMISSFEGKNEKPLLRDSVLGDSLFGEKDFFNIEVLSSELILFLSEKGELIVNRLPYRFSHAEIKGYEYAPRQKKLLVWTRSEIGVIDFSKAEEAESELFEQGPRLVWFYTSGDSIQKASWVYDASHVVFADKNRIFFLDLETFSKADVHELVRVKEGTAFGYTDQNGLLYYLDRGTGKLTAAELLPQKELILLPFPTRQEKTVKRRPVLS